MWSALLFPHPSQRPSTGDLSSIPFLQKSLPLFPLPSLQTIDKPLALQSPRPMQIIDPTFALRWIREFNQLALPSTTVSICFFHSSRLGLIFIISSFLLSSNIFSSWPNCLGLSSLPSKQTASFWLYNLFLNTLGPFFSRETQHNAFDTTHDKVSS